MSPHQQVGIFGGSFNPIHCGHIALARQLREAMSLNEVWFVVSPMNPFKEHAGDLLQDDLRLRMTEAALAGEPGLRACDVEFRLPRPSYMWNTLQHLSHLYPDTRFTLLIGADNWLAFRRWAHWEDILARYRLAVYPREDCFVDPTALPQNVHLLDSVLHPVSSTLIRERIRAGLPVTGMVPAAIEDMVAAYY